MGTKPTNLPTEKINVPFKTVFGAFGTLLTVPMNFCIDLNNAL